MLKPIQTLTLIMNKGALWKCQRSFSTLVNGSVVRVALAKKTADRIVALFNQTLCACLLQVCENENSHPSTQGQVSVSGEGSSDMKRNTVPDMILG